MASMRPVVIALALVMALVVSGCGGGSRNRERVGAVRSQPTALTSTALTSSPPDAPSIPPQECALDHLVVAGRRASDHDDPNSQIDRMYADGDQILAAHPQRAARSLTPIAFRFAGTQASFLRRLRGLPDASKLGSVVGEFSVLLVLEERVRDDLQDIASDLRALQHARSSAVAFDRVAAVAVAEGLYGPDVSAADHMLTELGPPASARQVQAGCPR